MADERYDVQIRPLGAERTQAALNRTSSAGTRLGTAVNRLGGRFLAGALVGGLFTGGLFAIAQGMISAVSYTHLTLPTICSV